MTVSFPPTKNNGDSEGNKDAVCNAFGCDRKGTIKTEVDCGTYGKLEIIVCDKCLNKFKTGMN